MYRFLRDNGLSLVLVALFVGFWAGQSVIGHRQYNEEQREHGEAAESRSRRWSCSRFSCGSEVLPSRSRWTARTRKPAGVRGRQGLPLPHGMLHCCGRATSHSRGRRRSRSPAGDLPVPGVSRVRMRVRRLGRRGHGGGRRRQRARSASPGCAAPRSLRPGARPRPAPALSQCLGAVRLRLGGRHAVGEAAKLSDGSFCRSPSPAPSW